MFKSSDTIGYANLVTFFKETLDGIAFLDIFGFYKMLQIKLFHLSEYV